MTKTLNLYPPLSTLKERMKHTPKNRPGKAYWDGPRGNSTYVVKPEQVKLLSLLNSFGLNGITYINAIADFRFCAIATVILTAPMSIKRYKNFALCDQLCADLWNQTDYLGCHEWTRHLVSEYRKHNHYSWHERNDRLQCDLVPTPIHSFFNHLGGISECKIARRLHINYGYTGALKAPVRRSGNHLSGYRKSMFQM